MRRASGGTTSHFTHGKHTHTQTHKRTHTHAHTHQTSTPTKRTKHTTHAMRIQQSTDFNMSSSANLPEVNRTHASTFVVRAASRRFERRLSAVDNSNCVSHSTNSSSTTNTTTPNDDIHHYDHCDQHHSDIRRSSSASSCGRLAGFGAATRCCRRISGGIGCGPFGIIIVALFALCLAADAVVGDYENTWNLYYEQPCCGGSSSGHHIRHQHRGRQIVKRCGVLCLLGLTVVSPLCN